MFFVTDKDIKKLERDLEFFAHRSIPFATKFALNTTARSAQITARNDVKKEFITRNAFTKQSIQFRKAEGLNINNQESAVGSTAPFMEIQEFGGYEFKTGKYGQVIPTSWAARQGNKIPRTKLPTKVNKLENIRLAKKINTGNVKTKRQEAFLRALLAARKGDKYVFIPGGGTASTGIYRVWGRKIKKGRPTEVRLKMAYSMRRGPSLIEKKPWLKPAVEKTIPKMPQFYKEALEFQAEKHGLFK